MYNAHGDVDTPPRDDSDPNVHAACHMLSSLSMCQLWAKLDCWLPSTVYTACAVPLSSTACVPQAAYAPLVKMVVFAPSRQESPALYDDFEIDSPSIGDLRRCERPKLFIVRMARVPHLSFLFFTVCSTERTVRSITLLICKLSMKICIISTPQYERPRGQYPR